jgi:excisionase family DNA binding protein
MSNHLTVAQVATAIGKSNKTVYRYLDEKRIKAVKNGFGYVVPRAAVVAYLRGEQRKARVEWQERIDRVRAA